MGDGNEIIRRMHQGLVSETVYRMHREGQGPGEPGGRTYDVTYAPDGRVRVDVDGCWSGRYHTVWIAADEVRPAAEWAAHLRATGRKPVEPRWCNACGTEIPADRIAREDPKDPEPFCSTDCYVESLPRW